MGFASFASRPQESNWSTCSLSWLSVMVNYIYGPQLVSCREKSVRETDAAYRYLCM
ncbi:hypothetical protein OROMI_028329 [Orobanche minor]